VARRTGWPRTPFSSNPAPATTTARLRPLLRRLPPGLAAFLQPDDPRRAPPAAGAGAKAGPAVTASTLGSAPEPAYYPRRLPRKSGATTKRSPMLCRRDSRRSLAASALLREALPREAEAVLHQRSVQQPTLTPSAKPKAMGLKVVHMKQFPGSAAACCLLDEATPLFPASERRASRARFSVRGLSRTLRNWSCADRFAWCRQRAWLGERRGAGL